MTQVELEAPAEEIPTPPKQRPLHVLPFTDIYLRLDEKWQARCHPMPDKDVRPGNMPVPEIFTDSLERLRAKLVGDGRQDFSTFHEGVGLRVSKLQIANGEDWCVLRRISGRVPKLEELNFPPAVVNVFKGFGRRAGLIVISGATGNGKTTTAAAMLSDYLTRYGLTAFTLEDPVEYPLQGEHGDRGYCFQIEVQSEEQWARGIHNSLRWHARYILVGEIRSGEAAAQVLRAATSGHLVITTVHAGSIEETISNFIQIARKEVGDRAPALLADGLIAVIHLELTPYGPKLRMVTTDPESAADPVRGCIREDQLSRLEDLVSRQEQAIRRSTSDPQTQRRG